MKTINVLLMLRDWSWSGINIVPRELCSSHHLRPSSVFSHICFISHKSDSQNFSLKENRGGLGERGHSRSITLKSFKTIGT